MSKKNLQAPRCKVVLLGDSAVGKTCIISRYILGSFDPNQITSSGSSYCTKSINYENLKKNIIYDIWDTAGQEKFRSLNKFFYKDAAICILVYAINKKESFENIKKIWYNDLRENADENIIIALVGNKCDLYEEENVKETEGRKYAEEIGAIFKLTSAQNNTGIEELFHQVGLKYLEQVYNIKPESGNKNDKIVINKNDIKKDKNKSCC